MNRAFLDYYRCPGAFAGFTLCDAPARADRPGYFEFSPGQMCYGRLSGGVGDGGLRDVASDVRMEGGRCVLPFDPTEVADNLRYERYVDTTKSPLWKDVIRTLYYALRPALPVGVRRHLQRAWLRGWEDNPFPRWPVDLTVDHFFEKLMRLQLAASGATRIPFIWFWPTGKAGCAIMTHDVETAAGLAYAVALMDTNDSFGIKSSFQLIPDARYTVSGAHVASIKARGFEVNVHDLKHDGHLFDEEAGFRGAAARINEFGERFGSRGFRAAILYRNQEWYDALRFDYDMSVPNAALLDPQRGGCCTVMPYFVGNMLELPVTATQDYTLFHVLNTYSLDLWRRQIDLILRQHGLISFIIHPDYLNTPQARASYTSLLAHLAMLRADANIWIALPGEVNTWWRQRHAMKLVPDETGWHIEGDGAERATLAYANLKDDGITYEFE